MEQSEQQLAAERHALTANNKQLKVALEIARFALGMIVSKSETPVNWLVCQGAAQHALRAAAECPINGLKEYSYTERSEPQIAAECDELAGDNERLSEALKIARKALGMIVEGTGTPMAWRICIDAAQDALRKIETWTSLCA